MKAAQSFHQLDLNLLRVFNVLFEEGSLTNAATRLYLTPSAISHALKRLREHLNDPLFVRQGQRMVPTPACVRLAPKVKQSLDSLHRALEAWQTFDSTTSDVQFTIAMRESLELSVLPELCGHLAQVAPNVSVSSVSLDREQMSSQLARGDIDFALDVVRPVSDDTAHCHFMTDDFGVVGWEAIHGKTLLDEQHYFNARHIAVSSRPRGATVEDIALASTGQQRRIALRCQSYQAAINVIASQRSIVTMPKTMARRLVVGSSLDISDLPLRLPSVINHLYWNRVFIADPALTWFKQQILALVD